MEDAGVDEDCTELSTLEKLISSSKEKIVSIKHDDPLIFNQFPYVEFVQC
jgi:hypothetical protein